MAKPRINKIDPIDASKEQVISFTWSGNRVYGNRLVIFDAVTLSTVYDETVSSFLLSHTIPANSLVNGKKYVAQVQVIDSAGFSSTLSDKMYFSALSTPVFQFVGLESGDKLTDASYVASVLYSQAQGETLESYQFYLYNAQRELLTETGIIYNTESISYTYKPLDSNNTYYFRCSGKTTNGISVDTGYVEVFVMYRNPSTQSQIVVENVPNKGYIRYGVNIIVIEYSGTETFTYVDNMIDLRNDKTVYYDQGYDLNGDFTLKAKGVSLYQEAQVLEMNDEVNNIIVESHIYDDGLRYKLTVDNGMDSYILYTKPMVFDNTDDIVIEVRRINNVYQLYVYVNGTREGV